MGFLVAEKPKQTHRPLSVLVRSALSGWVHAVRSTMPNAKLPNTESGLSPQLAEIENKPLHFKVVRGAMFSILRKIIVAPISLLLVPFTLHKIGVAGYGTWAILSTIINLTWLLDPGLS